jgi:hypothetical protein
MTAQGNALGERTAPNCTALKGPDILFDHVNR